MIIWILEDHNISKYFSFKNLVSKFSKLYPEVKIEFKIKSKKNMWKSVFNFIKSQGASEIADIIEIPHNWTSLFAKIGVLMEVKHYYPDFDIDKYPDFIKKSLFIERNYLFSVPWWFEIITLQYRADILKNFIKDKNMSFLSWDEFIDICDSLKKKNRKKDFYPLDNFNANGSINSHDLLPCVLNRSGNFFDKNYTMSNLLKDEVIAGIEDFISLAEKKYLPLFQENFYEVGFLSSGLSAMAFSWRLPDEIKKVKLTAVQFPQIRRKENIARSFNLVVSSSTKEINNCNIFFKWLMKEENLEFFCKSFKVFPPYKKGFEKICTSFNVYSELYTTLSLIEGFSVYPTFEILMDNLLFDISCDIVRGKYDREKLIKGLVVLKGEVDYLLSNYSL